MGPGRCQEGGEEAPAEAGTGRPKGLAEMSWISPLCTDGASRRWLHEVKRLLGADGKVAFISGLCLFSPPHEASALSRRAFRLSLSAEPRSWLGPWRGSSPGLGAPPGITSDDRAVGVQKQVLETFLLCQLSKKTLTGGAQCSGKAKCLACHRQRSLRAPRACCHLTQLPGPAV